MHSYELSINGVGVKFFGLTIPEINAYLNKVIAQKKGEGNYRDILTCQMKSLVSHIVDERYKLATICFYVLLRKEIIPRLCECDYITFDDIVSLEEVCPEIYCSLPVKMYIKYPELVNHLFNNKLVSYDELPFKVQKYGPILVKYNKVINGSNDLGDLLREDDGNFKQLFKIAGYNKYLTIDDYISIYRKFLVTGLTEKEFCFYYKIDNVEGFKYLISLANIAFVKNNNVEQLKMKYKSGVVKEINEIAELINKGKVSFQDYLNNYFDYTHRFSDLMPQIKNKRLFARQIIDYILEYSDELQLDKIRVLFGNDIAIMKNKIKTLACRLKLSNEIKIYISSLLKKYDNKYLSSSVKMKIISSNGEVIADINDEVIEKGYNYLRDHDICICKYTMDNICRKIAMGVPIIDNSGINRVRKK